MKPVECAYPGDSSQPRIAELVSKFSGHGIIPVYMLGLVKMKNKISFFKVILSDPNWIESSPNQIKLVYQIVSNWTRLY